MFRSRFAVRQLLIGLTISGMTVVSAQDYPSKSIHIITGTVGGGSDFDARQIAQGITGSLGQPVIVDNRPPILVGEIGSKTPPDGYTLFITGTSFWVGPLLRKAPYDVADFSPISLIEMTPNVVTVHRSLPVKNIKGLITLAKARPGQLNYSTGSAGSTTHLAVELFKSMAGVNIVKVPYKGTGPALAALVSGEVELTIVDVGLVAPHVKSGKLVALAVTSAQPSALAPGLPTVSASGLPGYESAGRTGIWAPAKTPRAIINRTNQEIVRFLNRSEVKERFLNAGVEIVASSPEEFAETVKVDMAKWGKVIKDANIKAD